MNTAHTPWYSAVPSMLMVAPKGRTKLLIWLGMPSLRAHSIDIGRVPELLQVLKAWIWAGEISRKELPGAYLAQSSDEGAVDENPVEDAAKMDHEDDLK